MVTDPDINPVQQGLTLEKSESEEKPFAVLPFQPFFQIGFSVFVPNNFDFVVCCGFCSILISVFVKN